MSGQTKTINTPHFISPPGTVIPQQEEEQLQSCEVIGNQFVQYDSHNPMVTQPPLYKPFLTPAECPRTIRDLWTEIPAFYRDLVMCLTAVAFGIVIGYLALSLSAAL